MANSAPSLFAPRSAEELKLLVKKGVASVGGLHVINCIRTIAMLHRMSAIGGKADMAGTYYDAR